jgi:hypothetical protein
VRGGRSAESRSEDDGWETNENIVSKKIGAKDGDDETEGEQ